VTRGPLVGAVAALVSPVGPVASASAQQTPGRAPLASSEVDLSSARPASHAVLAPYIRETSHAPPRGLSEPPTQEG
jgi:hypothetical protein